LTRPYDENLDLLDRQPDLHGFADLARDSMVQPANYICPAR